MLEKANPIASELRAILGPTNTGKTHRCIERMLEFQSGMLGFPLRLLAREVYDRVTERIGERRVALITGEEKRAPKEATYFICTVEAMPVQREVEFLAIDEIQLIAHPTRGHVFTQRLLEARGTKETWWIGSETVRPLLQALVPAAKYEAFPRLSRLSHATAKTLGRLPPRSAVVAFSVPRVYELAERIRARKGGAAVILGALSPRTRNAQVAMYQAGEVDYLVATDAIGMGLNLSLRHVAFAGLDKYDGDQRRRLTPAELAQVAGRAGRYLEDGTFGTVQPSPSMTPDVVQAIESHRFDAHRMASWRSANLDFSSLDAVLNSLSRPPGHPALRRFDRADDAVAFARLSQKAWVKDFCRTEERNRMLWAVCQVPDYRKLLPELHADLLSEVFERLTQDDGQLDDDWMERRVAPLDTTDGDLDTLTHRLAFIRTWTYLSQHSTFVRSAKTWRERTRAIEDRLSDALHDRLVHRFVEKSRHALGSPGPGKRVEGKPRTTKQGTGTGAAKVSRSTSPLLAFNPDSPFAELLHLRLGLASAPQSSEDSDWVRRCLEADATSFQLLPNGTLTFDSRPLARWTKGHSARQPQVRMLDTSLPAGEQSQVLRRLHAITRDLVFEGIERFCPVEHAPEVRGFLYQLSEGLGCLDIEQLPAPCTDAEKDQLRRLGVFVGTRFMWIKPLLRPKALSLRKALVQAHLHPVDLPAVETAAVSLARNPRIPSAWVLCLGYVPLGPRWVRCDIVERALAALAEPTWDPSALAGLLGCKKNDLNEVLRALGKTQSVTGSHGVERRIEQRRRRRARVGTPKPESQ